MTELKPCPFCNGQAEERYLKRKGLLARFVFPYSTHYVYIRCAGCGATSEVKLTSEGAIEAWNRRANDSEGAQE